MKVEFEGLPPSKKNGGTIARTKTGKLFFLPSSKARAFEKDLKTLAHLARPGTRPTPHPVRLVLTLDLKKRAGEVEVEEMEMPASVREVLGDRVPAEVGGRTLPDLVNALAVVADALEGEAYVNDRQVMEVVLRWR